MMQTILSKVSGILNFILIFLYIATVKAGTLFSAELTLGKALTVKFEAACLFANASILLLFGRSLKIFLSDNRNRFWWLRRIVLLKEVKRDVIFLVKDEMIIKIHIFYGLQRTDCVIGDD